MPPTVAALLLCISHWFGPSAIGRNRECAAICAILTVLANFPVASVDGCGAQFEVSNLLSPSEVGGVFAGEGEHPSHLLPTGTLCSQFRLFEWQCVFPCRQCNFGEVTPSFNLLRSCSRFLS
jgi:hypothetical protein